MVVRLPILANLLRTFCRTAQSELSRNILHPYASLLSRFVTYLYHSIYRYLARKQIIGKIIAKYGEHSNTTPAGSVASAVMPPLSPRGGKSGEPGSPTSTERARLMKEREMAINKGIDGVGVASGSTGYKAETVEFVPFYGHYLALFVANRKLTTYSLDKLWPSSKGSSPATQSSSTLRSNANMLASQLVLMNPALAPSLRDYHDRITFVALPNNRLTSVPISLVCLPSVYHVHAHYTDAYIDRTAQLAGVGSIV